MRAPVPLVVGRRLVALVATVIIAPTLAYVVFGALAGTLGESAPAGAWHYVDRTFVHLDFGYSQRFDGSMRDVLAWTLPVDVSMVVGSLALGLLLGVAGGLVAASREGTLIGRGLQGWRRSCSAARRTSCP
jgi:ABC-type antimicrobial peptide transport system permease subunit